LRTKVLTDAFKRQAKADIGRVEGLMAKAKNAGALAKILVDLVDEYPSMADGLQEALAKGPAKGAEL